MSGAKSFAEAARGIWGSNDVIEGRKAQFPALDPATEAALRASIERFGVLVPVVKDQAGRILDGHHRARLARELDVRYETTIHEVANEGEAREIAHTLNADRRHLTPEQRRPVVSALREEGHSLRAIGGALGVSHETVNRDLKSTVTPETVEEPERIIGLDGKSRQARRPKTGFVLEMGEPSRKLKAAINGFVAAWVENVEQATDEEKQVVCDDVAIAYAKLQMILEGAP